MIVYYRLSDKKLSASKPAPFTQDIFTIAKVCLRSFVSAFKDVSPKMVFICDYCPPKYDKMIRDIVPFEFEIHHTSLGINKTCLMQYEMYDKSDEPCVLFQEYDYLWLPDTGTSLEEGVVYFDYVTPYDHPDKYGIEGIVTAESITNRLWKETQSTTATFGTSKEIFTGEREVFNKYGYIDHSRWLEVTGKLCSPVPSLATHMCAEFMAPHIDWKAVWNSYL